MILAFTGIITSNGKNVGHSHTMKNLTSPEKNRENFIYLVTTTTTTKLLERRNKEQMKFR
jgi:hypothetical protein